MEFHRLVLVLKALSDPQRLRAVTALQYGDLCVCQIIDLLRLAPSTVSKHMSILRQAGVVRSRKTGKWVYYSLGKASAKNDTATFIASVIDCIKNDPAVKADRNQLREIMKIDPEILYNG
jgi:DNA-binding transcriptional ArsR family regulator